MQGILNQRQPGLARMVKFSFLLHVVVISLSLIAVRLTPPKVFVTPVYSVNLVDPALFKPKPVKKKVVKKTVAAKKKPAVKKKVVKKKAAKKPSPKPEPKVSVAAAIGKIEKDVEKKETETLVASRIEEIERKRRVEDEKVKADLEDIKRSVVDEEDIRKRIEELKRELASARTTDLEVEARTPLPTPSQRVTRELFDLEFKAYYNEVGARIQSMWVYPGEPQKGLEGWVSIKIGRDGDLKEVKIEKSSGNGIFDGSAIRAVKKAAPFPPLPEGIRGDFLEIGVRFHPGGAREVL
ncbi:MAG: cell envelope integrity protein TolA [Thermodesulfobacteriota bacterium]